VPWHHGTSTTTSDHVTHDDADSSKSGRCVRRLPIETLLLLLLLLRGRCPPPVVSGRQAACRAAGWTHVGVGFMTRQTAIHTVPI